MWEPDTTWSTSQQSISTNALKIQEIKIFTDCSGGQELNFISSGLLHNHSGVDYINSMVWSPQTLQCKCK